MTLNKPFKILFLFILTLLAAWMLLVKAPAVYAQDDVELQTGNRGPLRLAKPLEESPTGEAEIPLSFYEVETQEMLGRSMVELQMELPFRWEVVYGDGKTQAVIHYDYTIDDPDAKYSDPDLVFNLWWDGQFFASLPLEEGLNRTMVVDIPDPMLLEEGEERNIRDNDHALSIQLRGGYGCDLPEDYQDEDYADFTVILHDSTFVSLDYDLLAPELDLAHFPAPIYEASLLDETIYIVIPTAYTEADLETAVSLSATIGARTFRNAMVEIISASEASATLFNANAILVGEWDKNEMIQQLIFDRATSFKVNEARELISQSGDVLDESHGILEEIIAPYSNGNYTNLIVTGRSETAVAKAAQAISVGFGDPRLGFVGPTAIIEAFIEDNAIIEDKEVITLEELGFTDRTYYNLNVHIAQINFFVPSNWEFTDDPVLKLPFIVSDALAEDKTGITVRFNNAPVASVLTVNEETGLDELIVTLPREDIRHGETNRIRLNIRNAIDDYCDLPSNDMIWTRILGNGAIYLPHQLNSNLAEEIQNPISPLLSTNNLSDVMFSLPTEPTAKEINGMADIAWLMGSRVGGEGFMPIVRQGEMSAGVISHLHHVMIGTPLRNPMIAQVNDVLPQPFMPNSNELSQTLGNIIFKLPDDFSVGLVETVVSPWNDEKAVTVVTGTSDLGFDWALDAFEDPAIFSTLRGNLAFMREDRVESINTMTISDSYVFEVGEEEVVVPVEPELELVVEEVYEPLVPRETGDFEEKYQPVFLEMPRTVSFASIGLVGLGVLLGLLGLILRNFKITRS